MSAYLADSLLIWRLLGGVLLIRGDFRPVFSDIQARLRPLRLAYVVWIGQGGGCPADPADVLLIQRLSAMPC